MSNPTTKSPRTSRLGRSMVAGVTAARVGAKQVRHQLRSEVSRSEQQSEHEAEIGRVLFQALSQLRGTALKASQVLGMYAGLLPEGVRLQLARATHQALPLNRALISRAFRQAFGREPQTLFAHFEADAVAAASLGQVHRARLADGTDVAVKIQYPGIAQTIDTDLQLLRASLRVIRQTMSRASFPLPHDDLIDLVLAEIRRQLEAELDYLHEAKQQTWFSDHTTMPGITVAAPILEFSCKTVLTQQWLPGVHLDSWLQTDPAPLQRTRAAQNLFDWFVQCAFVQRRIHADWHPGNFLFNVDGTVGVLDFGNTCELSPSFTQCLARSWLIWTEQGRDGAPRLLANYGALGVVDPGLGLADFSNRVLPQIGPVLDWATQPLKSSSFDFSKKTAFPTPAQGGDAAAVGSLMTTVPLEMLSFDRAWFGLMYLLSRLAATVDTRAARELVATAARPEF